MKTILLACLALGGLSSPAQESPKYPSIEESRTGLQSVYGLVSQTDRDGKSFHLRNADGLIEVRLAKDARIGLLFRERGIKKMLEERKVKIAAAGREFDLPEKLYVKVDFGSWKSARRVLKSGKFRDGFVHATPLPDHLPTEAEPWLSGELSSLEPGHITPVKVVTIDARTFKGSTSGFNYSERLAGLLDPGAIRPFVNQASVHGKLQGSVFHASHVLLRPIPDQVALDDPKLPRCLFIGDSISGNYGRSLRDAVEGKLNIHHPPTNCGPSGKGKRMMQAWLGGHELEGRRWDVISFNFGHWDAGNTKDVYQANLRSVIRQLGSTGAKLVWVTTCPVPNGFDRAGELGPGGKAPGRKAGVMERYLNPWALEVVERHPGITICDQWRYCKEREDSIYKEWWAGKNVHFKGEPAAALGRLLAEHVLKVLSNGRADSGE